MQLLIKRSKIFRLGNKKVVVNVGPMPQTVPEWARKTGTYEAGIKDGSILNVFDTAVQQQAVADKKQPKPADVGDGEPDEVDDSENEGSESGGVEEDIENDEPNAGESGPRAKSKGKGKTIGKGKQHGLQG